MPHRYQITFTYHPDGLPLKRPSLVGSWDSLGRFHEDWTDSGRPLEPLIDGSWQVDCLLEAEAGQIFSWGVRDSGEWMLFGQTALNFEPANPAHAHQRFTLGYRHHLGLNPRGADGFTVGVWAPHARAIELVIDPSHPRLRLPLSLSDGFWTAGADSGFCALEGLPYAFAITTSEAQTVLRSDPYARRRQGPQRGLSDFYYKADGSPTHRYAQDPRGGYALRFEAIERSKILSSPPVLRLFKDGQPLSQEDLIARLHSATPQPIGEPWWADHVQPDGSMPLVARTGLEAYALCLGPTSALLGLTYQIVDADGSAYHDHWHTAIDGYHNWPRFGLVSRPLQGLRRHRHPSEHPEDLIIYELHVGSLLGQGGNLLSSTYADIVPKLVEIKNLGFTAIALMPHGPSEGLRDWGYLGSSSFAHQEAYATPGESAESGLLAFLKAAHDLGLIVLADVVYNHIGGNHNDLWNFDGYKNPWFEWNDNPELGPSVGGDLPLWPSATANALPQTASPSVRNTPWGPIPALIKPPVAQFFLDHATDLVARLGFDGLRFDFTHLIHSQPTGGGHHGWLLLQEIHRRLRHFFPDLITVAEEFPPHPILTTPVSDGGAGFDSMWNTEHQHRLVYSRYQQSIAQALSQGKAPPLAAFLEQLLHPQGFEKPNTSITVLSNHDEVGNATRLATIVAAHPQSLELARLICWVSLLSPGYPILFQGTEDLADNAFTWGVPSSWDVASHLLSKELPTHRRLHLQAIGDVLRFRRQEHDLHGKTPITNSYLHEDHRLLAFKRGKFWIVANFSTQTYPLPDEITIDGSPVLSSEDRAYGRREEPSQDHEVGSLALKVYQSPST